MALRGIILLRRYRYLCENNTGFLRTFRTTFLELPAQVIMDGELLLSVRGQLCRHRSGADLFGALHPDDKAVPDAVKLTLSFLSQATAEGAPAPSYTRGTQTDEELFLPPFSSFASWHSEISGRSFTSCSQQTRTSLPQQSMASPGVTTTSSRESSL